MNPLSKLCRLYKRLPLSVSISIDRNVRKHIETGGKADDPYIYEQIEYAQHVLNKRRLNKVG